MTSVILGVDPGVHRLGIAACDLVTGEPLRCISHPISIPGIGPLHQQIGAALREVGEYGAGWEPAILAVEDPTHASRGKKQAAQWGGILALIEAEALRRWPHIECWRISPPGWKKGIGLAGNATRDEYGSFAVTCGWAIPGDTFDYDAAAAACVAMWAFDTNQRQVAA